ncbi:MAG: penicillin acylase family protein [Fibrobacterota bacterium]|nr:penicillin acylase family protein [Fibrobacterota bacterium]
MKSNSRPGWIKPVALAGILVLFLIFIDCRLGPIPPLARLLNPFSGFWLNAEGGGFKDDELRAPGLHETVSVIFDKRHVPHIFAQNAHDLFFAQGYITARDRLWQMEIQCLSAAGRLAEILGPEWVDHDLFQRRLGILRAAEKVLEKTKHDDESWQAAQAYADGVNAWIANLGPGNYPLEYKLLDYAPSHWTPLNTALMLKHMQWTLSGGGNDLPMTNTLAKLGPDFVGRYFPERRPDVPPIIPSGTSWNPESPPPAIPPGGIDLAGQGFLPGNFLQLPVLTKPDSSVTDRSKADTTKTAAPKTDTPKTAPRQPTSPLPVPLKRPDPGNGSNNFVFSGAKTLGGAPILANDPHLDLGLPSIWYEIQLSAPGMSVYGVSMPGAPAVVIGFNRKIAWGMTNGHDDVFDWYRMTFKDSTLAEYMHGSKWKRTRQVVEAIKVRGGKTRLDTVIYTHQGPLTLKSQERPWNRNTPTLHALRWLALDPSDELKAFLRIMKAGSYREFQAALDPFHCPAQNFAFASVDGDIAMFHHGRFPRKWKGQGRFTLDGSEPGNDWSGWLPRQTTPATRNPEQGWLFSANQTPTDSSYPYYLGTSYLDGQRAKRLGQILADTDSLTAEGAFGIMMDDFNLHAAEILPTLLEKISKAVLSKQDSASLREIAAWDYRHGAAKRAPALLDKWWAILHKSIWLDEFGGDSIHYQWPNKDRTRKMIVEEPDADWFDDITTPSKETLGILALRSFREASAILRDGSDWGEYRPVRIRHLARIDAFGSEDLRTGGCQDCVNALKATHGPSWRMVVTMEKEPKGIGIYPGGQSGNPGSPHYGEFIKDWAEGRHYPLLFLSNPRSAQEETSYSLQLRGK